MPSGQCPRKKSSKSGISFWKIF